MLLILAPETMMKQSFTPKQFWREVEGWVPADGSRACSTFSRFPNSIDSNSSKARGTRHKPVLGVPSEIIFNGEYGIKGKFQRK